MRHGEMPALTLATARQTLWKYAPGADGTSVSFAQATQADEDAVDAVINQAIERFITSGRWRGLEVRARFRVYQNQITLPSTLDSVIGVTPIRGVDDEADVDNALPLSIYSSRHEFLPHGPGNPATYCMNGIVDLGGGFPTFRDPTGTFYLKAVSSAAESSKTILFKGLDADDLQIYTAAVEGVSLNLTTTPGNTTSQSFSALSSWQKNAATSGVVRVYSVDTTSAEETLLVVIPPTKLVSGYHRYRVPTATWGDTVECLCKRAYVPAVADNDILVISNLGALKLMMMSLQFEDRVDFTNANLYENKAIDLVNKELGEFENNPAYAIQFNDTFGAGSIPVYL